VEDPIEFSVQGVNQFQVNEKAGFTFANALRAILRQDPNVLMVGEVRDAETARLATQAALTGHLVLSTLHTNDAPGAITRLFNLGIEPYLVGATLCGVMAQRLVRKLCQHCKEPYDASINEKRQIEKFTSEPVAQLFRPRGCSRCRNLGYAGRIGIYELLVPNDHLIDRISQGGALNEIREAARSDGMKTLRHDGMEKIRAGITTLEEVYRVTA
jgi:type IV pilus assembly protein PilB